jgi:hypothetical protein
VVENLSLWLIAPLLLAGGNAVVYAFDKHTSAARHRAAVLSMLALTLGSIPFCVECSQGARILGLADLLIGALALAFVL